ncbi:MAG TPA: aspartate--tRNA ligase [Frankiaceae bacterium]|nr:aspartate--tRNA ligase [Frankiaceae bacterium]
MIRTHEAGRLRAENAGTEVVLAGWVASRRDHGGVVFIDLRDASGVVQCVLREGTGGELRSEFCLRVVGEVRARPEGNENPDLATGGIEVAVSSYDILSTSDPLPFPLDVHAPDISEERRLQYRYLDLRREPVADALKLRSRITSAARRVMDARGFLDVETPYLTRSTPEGARDFLVPVRLQPGSWYALPQSPQLFKQLLMVGGLERYYQFARCFRDEDFRADRQPEFTQLDIEMSFCEQDDVIALGEEILTAIWGDVLHVKLSTPFPRMTYGEAMRRYGSDKPDTRFEMELVDLTGYFEGTGFKIFASSEHVGAVVVPGGGAYTRRQLDGWNEWSRSRGGKGVAYVLVGDDGIPTGGIAKNLSEQEVAGLSAATGAAPGDAIFFQAGPRAATLEALGALRLAAARDRGVLPEGGWNFLWVTDAPMFEPVGDGLGEDGGWTSVHHPFTRPRAEDEAILTERPGEALAIAYDVVLNGSEIGGGSLRIHERELQQKVFGVLGLSEDEARAQFGFLLDAFRFGPPPHGGIAFGWDRVCMLAAAAGSIRDVIAFPKTASGGDPLTGAPTPITAAQRKEAGIDFVPEPKA